MKKSPPRTRNTALTALRKQVEKTDDALLALLVRRARVARAIGKAKLQDGLPVLDPAREASVVRRAASRARKLGLPPEDVRTLFWGIIAMCRGEQMATSRTPAGRRGVPPKSRSARA